MQAIRYGLAHYGVPELVGNLAAWAASWSAGRLETAIAAALIFAAGQAGYYTAVVVRGLCESRGGFI